MSYGNSGKYGEQGTGYASSYSGSFGATDLVAGAITITHGMGTDKLVVSVYDDYGKQIIPDDVTVTANNVVIDLTSFGTINRAWSVVIVSSNSNPIPVGEVWGNITGNIGDQTDLATALTTYYRPRILQLPPTTSTAGFLGEVVYDASSNKWTCIKIDGSTYYWSPEGFPAVNTEYPAYIEGGVLVWKKVFSGISGAGTV